MDLKIKNIGGLVGTHDYDIQPGVNRITGPNASGKSSLIRGIECLVTDDNDLFRRTLNDDNDIGYVKFGEYERNLQRVDAQTVKASIDDKTFYEKKKDWEHVDDIVFFTPDSWVVEEIEQGRFDVRRYIERISKAEILKGDIFRKEQQLIAKNKELEQYIDNLKRAQELESDIEVLEGEIEELLEEEARLEKAVEDETGSKDLKIISGDIASKKQDIREREERLRRREADVKLYTDKYENAKSSYDRHEAIIKKFATDYPDPKSQLDVFKNEMRVHEDEKAKLKNKKDEVDKIHGLVDSAYKMFGDSNACPCCNQSTTLESLDERKKELRGESADLASKIKYEDEQIKHIKAEASELNNSISKQASLERERDKFRTEMHGAKKQLGDRKDLTDDIDSEISALQKELEVLQKDYAKVSSSLKSESKENLKSIQAKITGYENDTKRKKQEIDKLTRSIPDYIIGESLEDYARKKEEGKKKLRDEVADLTHMYEKEMFGAVDKFNANINEIYNKLGFKNFSSLNIVKEIVRGKLDALKLIVQHKSGKEQAVDTLSKAEQLTLGLVIQIAAKENYIPDFPFFVLDESINAYDQDRYAGILNYLSDKAEYVILSQKVPLSEQNEVVIRHGIA